MAPPACRTISAWRALPRPPGRSAGPTGPTSSTATRSAASSCASTTNSDARFIDEASYLIRLAALLSLHGRHSDRHGATDRALGDAPALAYGLHQSFSDYSGVSTAGRVTVTRRPDRSGKTMFSIVILPLKPSTMRRTMASPRP